MTINAHIVTLGTVSMDLYYQGSSLTIRDSHFSLVLGGKYFADFFHEGLGGGATNVAIAAKRSGADVSLIAKIGNNTFKPLLMEKLKETGISDSLLQYEDDYMNVSTILLSPDGEKTVINYRTPHQHFVADEDHFRAKLTGEALYVANLPNVSLAERKRILQIARAKEMETIINLGVDDCRRETHQIEELIHYANILIVNRHEFADILKVHAESLDLSDFKTYVHYPFLAEKTIIVTDGKHGSYGYENGHVHKESAVTPRRIIDTTGAGDGYTGAFIATYLKSRNLPTAMNKASIYAAHKLTHLGAN